MCHQGRENFSSFFLVNDCMSGPDPYPVKAVGERIALAYGLGSWNEFVQSSQKFGVPALPVHLVGRDVDAAC
jgi:hypothetical protein